MTYMHGCRNVINSYNMCNLQFLAAVQFGMSLIPLGADRPMFLKRFQFTVHTAIYFNNTKFQLGVTHKAADPCE